MISKDDLIWLIKDCSFDYFIPDYSFGNYKSGYFQKTSYLNTAILELLRYVNEYDGDYILDALHNFYDEMTRLSLLVDNEENYFEIARQFVWNVIDLCECAR